MENDILKGAKVLWVEDDKFLRNMIDQRLAPTGADLVSVTDGAKALETIKSYIPDIIMLDLLMPNVDGFEILKLVKSDDSVKHIPVLVLSNLGQKEEVERCKKLGAEDFIIKATIGLDDIIPRIRAVLAKTKTHQ
ncbi:MAG TPA: response regulator [Candidatus Paceibacterota bacterium]|jgi:PleD family two-component response regulator|nr:response regulator [Candidatus Paceibacterota bacterium]